MNKEEIEERIKYAKSNFTDGIEILLEIIEKLEQENKKIKEIKGMKESIELAGMKVDDFYKAIRTCHQLEQENNKLNKIIDEMANHIANWDVEEDICAKVEKPLCDTETAVPVSYCIECVKQYFEKKVEEK